MNHNTLEAVVEGGLLRPLKQLDLLEQQHVLVTIVELKEDVCKTASSCYEMAIDLGVIGTADEAPDNLSTNPVHLSGFGD